MRHIKLSIITMIVTGFILKVIRKFKNARRTSPYTQLARHLGIDVDRYETAVSNAKKCPDFNLNLYFKQISDYGYTKDVYFTLGKSLGAVCDCLITEWCYAHIGTWQAHFGHYAFHHVDIQTVGEVTNGHPLKFPPMNVEDMEGLLDLYNSLLSKAK